MYRSSPDPIQNMNRRQALPGRPYMMNRHADADSRLTAHTNGTLNGRGRFGSTWLPRRNAATSVR